MKKTIRLERGSVLIVALLMMVMIAMLSVTMMRQQSDSIIKTKNTLDLTKARLIFQGLNGWALTSLAANAKHQQGDQQIDQLPMVYPSTAFPGGHFFAKVEDAQAKFNINNLVNPVYYSVFSRLIGEVDPHYSDPDSLASAVMAWVTEYHMGSSQQDLLYAAQPYLPAHHVMADISELRLVHGMTSALYQALLPYVTVLPGEVPINVNTASSLLLRALVPGLTEKESLSVLADRQRSPFLTATNFFENTAILQHQFNALSEITVVSDYFFGYLSVTINDNNLHAETLYHRSALVDKNNILVEKRWQIQR